MNKYIGVNLKAHITIDKLFTVHYFEYPSNFNFYGEKHNFWEFVYVDKGTVIINADENEFILRQNEVFFHKPNQWHSIRCNESIAANVVVVSFSTASLGMEFFTDKLLCISEEQKELISKIIYEYKNSFSTPIDNINTYKITRKRNQLIAGEQLLQMHLTEFLLLFLRPSSHSGNTTVMHKRRVKNLIDLLTSYMQDNLYQKVTLEDLIKYSCSNRTTITSAFNKHLQKSPIEYYIFLKTEEAKKLLRENSYNISQIAQLLGYQNAQYFSKQFKKQTGTTPQEYARSIRAIK